MTSLSAQTRDYDICFAEFLEPSGNGQKFIQAILLREAFRRFAQARIGNKAGRSDSDTGRELRPRRLQRGMDI